jgi:Na+/proline symporter
VDHAAKQQAIRTWLAAEHAGDESMARAARTQAVSAESRADKLREQAQTIVSKAQAGATANDADYVFITFITQQLPHGLIGLMMAAFCAATLSSKSAELNALASTTTVDVYRHLLNSDAPDAHYVLATRLFTVMWGLAALAFALFANMAENLIQAVNIVGSIFYGVVLGLFLAAFFLTRVRGTAVFWAALAAQALVFVLYARLEISYLWFNVIGCVACLAFSVVLQSALDIAGVGREEELLSP